MKTAKKTFAIILLVLTFAIWLFQCGIRNSMSQESLFDFDDKVKDYLGYQIFEDPEVSKASRTLSYISVAAKFFEGLILPFCVVAAILIIRNSTKKKITLIPGIVLLVIVFFNLFCIMVSNSINNIESIQLVAKLFEYKKGVNVNALYPVMSPLPLKINSALIAIPAIGFLTCGIFDIVYLKKNPEDAVEDSTDPKLKKARLFYMLSVISIVALLLVASFTSVGFNTSLIRWIFKYFYYGYFLFFIAAIVFFVI